MYLIKVVHSGLSLTSWKDASRGGGRGVYLVDGVGDDAQDIVDDVDDAVLDGDVRDQDLGPDSTPPELRISLVDFGDGIH